MKRTESALTRRGFLTAAVGAALAGVAGMGFSGRGRVEPAAREPAARKARVVLIRNREVLDRRRPDPALLSAMLDEAVAALLGESEPAAAWRRLIGPDDVVGIKSNEWRFLPTPRVLEEILLQRVVGAGVARKHVGVDDRGVLRNPVFRESTALINVRPLRTHHWAGVGSCLKNYIMFSPNPPDWHGDNCAHLGGLWDLPLVRGKTRLNILVMLTPLFHGKGPHHFQSRYTWEYKGLVLGTDPVAVDATGERILRAKRREFFGKEEPFSVSPKHIPIAESRYRLGVADPARIEVEKIGWMEGVLI